MSYCVPSDLETYGINAEAISELSAQDKIAPIIASISDEIDSYLRGAGYALPLVSYGNDIKAAAGALTAAELLIIRGVKPGENPEDNEIFRRADRIREWLKLVATGKVVPSMVDSTPPAIPGVIGTGPGWGFIESNEPRGYTSDLPGRGYAFQGRRG
jgi:hypothetical protein